MTEKIFQDKRRGFYSTPYMFIETASWASLLFPFPVVQFDGIFDPTSSSIASFAGLPYPDEISWSTKDARPDKKQEGRTDSDLGSS